jgi:sn-glycerol 3-phosphate transport system permease protein
MTARASMIRTGELTPRLGYALVLLIVAAWAIPFIWMLVAAFRPERFGSSGMASLIPAYIPTLGNFREAWESADFIRYGINTAVICGGILAVQIITMSLAAFAFARMTFRGRDLLFFLFLAQMMLVPIVLLVPNLRTVAQLGLYDTLLGVMAPYFATAFGTFLMRQAFQSIPRELEDAALMDGAHWWHLIRYIYLPLSKPALIAFSIVSVTSHWNEFLWPLMVINSPENRPLTVGLATFTRGAEGAQAWGTIAAGTFIVIAPLLIGFALFQRRFINSFMTTGIK